MSSYASIRLFSEKNALVIDIGTAYTKCGFAGEAGPRCIIPSTIKECKTGKIINITTFNNSKDLYVILVDFVFNIYFKHVLVNPKDRQVIIVESVMCVTAFKQALAKVFFKHFEVPGILFVPSHLMPLFTLGISSAIVLDVGYSESSVLPIYENVPLLHAWQSLPLGGKAIHQYLNELLIGSAQIKVEHNDKPFSAVMESLPEDVLEDIKVQTCFVTKFERGEWIEKYRPELENANLEDNIQKNFKPPPDVNYPLYGNMILHIPGRVREMASEVLFQMDADEVSVATAILDSLLLCPVDTRKVLAENIIVAGGTAMLQGFKHRLKNTMLYLLSTPKYQKLPIQILKFHKPPSKENYTSWLGASIFGATDVLVTRCITRDKYLQCNIIPDWSNQVIHLSEGENKCHISDT